jgi:vitamin B12/bleomycin/antimicrobial peptide transport system ATP-binding/permease protein
MQKLGLAVASFALLALVVGVHKGDTETLLLAAASLLCAYATWKSVEISSFLKIFIGIFSVELLVFGILSLLDAEQLWPESLQDYALPESLAMTVAVFSSLAFFVSYVPVIGRMTRIADLYFDSQDKGPVRFWRFPAVTVRERAIAIAMIVALVLINQALVGVSVRLTFFRRDMYNALQDMNAGEFWRQTLFVFTPWAFTHIGAAVAEYVLQSSLIIRWRRWLTEHYISRWLGGHRHYAMALVGGAADNPDQRIAEDVNRFIDGGSDGYGIYSYSILLISTLSSLVSYSIVLWGLSGNYPIPGTAIIVPGLLFWVAVIYTLVGSLVTHFIGQPLTRLMFEQQRREADFRFSLARLREYGEQVALLRGEGLEHASLSRRFAAVFSNFMSIINLRKKITAFTATYGQASVLIPYLIAAPFYFAGRFKIGVLTQTAAAFGEVESALNFFVRYYVYLADYRAVLDRLTSFDAAAAAADELISRPAARPGASAGLSLDVALSLPDGRRIVEAKGVGFAPGVSVLLSGPSGSGKSTLFRAIAGVWPYYDGVIATPKDEAVMLLPQRPYIPQGSLAAALAYPGDVGAFPRPSIEDALVAARLGAFKGRLDEESNWGQRLSGGEQQRVAIARALLAKPDWLFLDEATSALDEKLEAEIYAMLKERLPQTTLVSIGHRMSLQTFHEKHLAMQPAADGVFAPREQVLAL